LGAARHYLFGYEGSADAGHAQHAQQHGVVFVVVASCCMLYHDDLVFFWRRELAVGACFFLCPVVLMFSNYFGYPICDVYQFRDIVVRSLAIVPLTIEQYRYLLTISFEF
jgi:hypothetical protein